MVEVQDFSAQDYTVNLNASGIVKARTQSSLVTEVAGKIIEISPNFRPGAYISEGELLLTLDDVNYQDAIRIAKSNIAANEAALDQLDQEERNTQTNLQLARENLQTVQQNLNIAQRNLNNVQRKSAPINKNTDLIQRNINLAKQNFNITKKNLELAKNDLGLSNNDLQLAQQNLALANKELERVRQLRARKLIPINQLDAQEAAVLQQKQAVSQQRQQLSQQQQKILQLEQSLVQQQQSIVQQEQQLTQQDQSLAQQDQNVLSQQQQILQQQQAVNQQKQNVANLEGQLATFDSRRNSLQANNDLTRTQLQQQERNLERTRIYAPYDGRILEQRVDIGQYVSPNSVLGVLYATDYVEVDMPLTLAQFSLLNIPDALSGEEPDFTALPQVKFTLPFDRNGQSWSGYVTGTRAALNEQSRQITVVARIDNPFQRSSDNTMALKIGQYLNAEIEGRTFENVFVLPPVAVRQNEEVLQMRDNQVHIAPIEVLWSNEQDVVLTSSEDLGAAPIIMTALGQATQGLKVALPGQKQPAERGRGQRRGGDEAQAAPDAGNGDAPASLRDKPDSTDSNLSADSAAENADNTPRQSPAGKD
ncbi:MAG: hypothetical protein R3E89_17730 [Thiolinea sp.]